MKWPVASGLVLLLACWVAFSGLGANLPLESHEALVARGAEEMLARGSILVPYFNDQPRLKKPPMSYWLVIAADSMSAQRGVITEFEARLPSAVAAVLIVAMTMVMGRLAIDRSTGLIAGLIVAASAGYVSYSHSARPEMVYAMFCTAAMLCFIASWRLQGAAPRSRIAPEEPRGAAPVSKRFEPQREHEPPQPLPRGRGAAVARLIPLLGWALLGGAMITKGPQIPLVLIAGLLLGFRAAGQWRDVPRIMRPWTGLLLFVVMALWWYVAVLLTVPDAMRLWRDEIGDHLAGPDTPWWSVFAPYYLYRTAGLVMPWVVLYAVALAMPFIKPAWRRDGNRLLWWIVVMAMIGMSVSMGRRWYYLLPMIAPLAVLMAGGALAAGTLLMTTAGRVSAQAIVALHGIALAGAVIWMWRTEPAGFQPPPWGLTISVLAGMAAAAVAMTWRAGRETALGESWAAALIAGAVFLAVAADNGSLWGSTRQEYRDFSDRVLTLVAHDEPLVGWDDAWAATQYYADRIIPEVDRSGELSRIIKSSGSTWVLVNSEEPIKLPDDADGTMMLAMSCDGCADGLQLWRVTRRRAAVDADHH